MIEDGRKKKCILEVLGDDEREIMLENNKHILKLVWKKDTGNYFWEIRRYDSPATKDRKIRCKKELKKSLFQIQSIVDIFLAQKN